MPKRELLLQLTLRLLRDVNTTLEQSCKQLLRSLQLCTRRCPSMRMFYGLLRGK